MNYLTSLSVSFFGYRRAIIIPQPRTKESVEQDYQSVSTCSWHNGLSEAFCLHPSGTALGNGGACLNRPTVSNHHCLLKTNHGLESGRQPLRNGCDTLAWHRVHSPRSSRSAGNENAGRRPTCLDLLVLPGLCWVLWLPTLAAGLRSPGSARLQRRRYRSQSANGGSKKDNFQKQDEWGCRQLGNCIIKKINFFSLICQSMHLYAFNTNH